MNSNKDTSLLLGANDIEEVETTLSHILKELDQNSDAASCYPIDEVYLPNEEGSNNDSDETREEDQTAPTLDPNFWTTLKRSIGKAAYSADPDAEIQALITHVRKDCVMPGVDDSVKYVLKKELEPVFDDLDAAHLDKLGTNARGRLLVIKKEFGFRKPPDDLFTEKGMAERKWEKDCIERMARFVNRLENDRSISKYFLPAINVSQLSTLKKSALSRNIMNHVGDAWKIDPPPFSKYKNRFDRSSVASASTHAVPTEVTFFKEVFAGRKLGFVGTYAHEGEHAMQANQRWRSNSQHHSRPVLQRKKALALVSARLKSGKLIGKARLFPERTPLHPHDEYRMNIISIRKRERNMRYDNYFGKQNEREGWTAGVIAVMLAAKSKRLNPTQGGILKDIDLSKSRGNPAHLVANRIQEEIGLTLAQMVTRDGFRKGAATTPAKNALNGLMKFRTLLDDPVDPPKFLKYGLLSSMPELIKFADDESHPLHNQCELIFYTICVQLPPGKSIEIEWKRFLQNRHDVIFATKAEEYAKPPSPPEQLNEAQEILRKLAKLYPDNLTRQILLEGAWNAVTDPKPALLRTQMEKLILSTERKRNAKQSDEKKTSITV